MLGIYVFVYNAKMRIRAREKENKGTSGTVDPTDTSGSSQADSTEASTNSVSLSDAQKKRLSELMLAEAKDVKEADALHSAMLNFLPQLKGSPQHGQLEVQRRGLADKWVSQVMDGLKKKAWALGRKRKGKEALGMYSGYNGPFKNETVASRNKIVKSIKDRAARRKKRPRR
jgi:hypothetical protein